MVAACRRARCRRFVRGLPRKVDLCSTPTSPVSLPQGPSPGASFGLCGSGGVLGLSVRVSDGWRWKTNAPADRIGVHRYRKGQPESSAMRRADKWSDTTLASSPIRTPRRTLPAHQPFFVGPFRFLASKCRCCIWQTNGGQPNRSRRRFFRRMWRALFLTRRRSRLAATCIRRSLTQAGHWSCSPNSRASQPSVAHRRGESEVMRPALRQAGPASLATSHATLGR